MAGVNEAYDKSTPPSMRGEFSWSPDEVERAEKFGTAHTIEGIRPRLERARARGYSVNPGLILEGSWGMGAAVFDRNKNPVYALSLTGIESRFRGERQEFLGKALLSEAHRLTLQLQRPWA